MKRSQPLLKPMEERELVEYWHWIQSRDEFLWKSLHVSLVLAELRAAGDSASSVLRLALHHAFVSLVTGRPNEAKDVCVRVEALCTEILRTGDFDGLDVVGANGEEDGKSSEIRAARVAEGSAAVYKALHFAAWFRTGRFERDFTGPWIEAQTAAVKNRFAMGNVEDLIRALVLHGDPVRAQSLVREVKMCGAGGGSEVVRVTTPKCSLRLLSECLVVGNMSDPRLGRLCAFWRIVCAFWGEGAGSFGWSDRLDWASLVAVAEGRPVILEEVLDMVRGIPLAALQ